MASSVGGVAARTIKTVTVIGGGLMGSGIAQASIHENDSVFDHAVFIDL